MSIQDKLKIIQSLSGLTQTEIAYKIGVSFVAFNNWWTDKAKPRKKQEDKIDEMYKKYTGQKEIPASILIAKKKILAKKSEKFKNILKILLKNSDIYDQFLLSLTYNSNKIEGSTLSEDETADILFNNTSIPNKSIVEQLEVKNHQTSLQYLFQHLSSNGKIDEDLILKLHSILMNGIIFNAGIYRSHGVRIVGSNVPTANYLKVPILMKNIIKDINKKYNDSINHVSRIHAEFERIHPFSDGNGRVGRMLLTAMLLKNNFAPAVILQEEKRIYYICLRKAQLQDDFSLLEEFIVEAIENGLKIVDRK